MKSTKLKSAQVRLGRVVENISTVEADIKALQSNLQKLKSQKSKVQSEIDQLTSSDGGLIVSEHALIRYMERVMDFDMSLIAGAMLEDQLKSAHQKLGNGTYPLSDGNKVVIRNNTIVSVLE